MTTRRLAANPLPYLHRPGSGGRIRKNFEEAFADFADIGYVAVKADPLDQTPEKYLTGPAGTACNLRSVCSACRSTRRSTSLRR